MKGQDIRYGISLEDTRVGRQRGHGQEIVKHIKKILTFWDVVLGSIKKHLDMVAHRFTSLRA